MHSDLTRVRQLLYNLLSNACKFTEKGVVTLRVTREDRDGRPWVRFVVGDSGIGMTPEQLQKVFRPFTQADSSTTRKYGGTGLGLAISRRIVEMLGGTLVAQSRLGEGSEFTVLLPAGAEPAGSGPEGRPAPAAGGPETILVIDDDPIARDLMRNHLTRGGFDVVCASSGEEGLRLARDIRPAAITLDVLMPNMDGWAVLREIKCDPNLGRTPVVMVTIVDEHRLAMALGATDYLVKPVDREHLLSVMARHRPPPGPGRVLVVDDDADFRRLAVHMAAREGWKTVEAADGREALARVAEARPDLILLDLLMPVMNGFEFLGALRSLQGAADVPVVVVTAKTLAPEEFASLNREVENVLKKSEYDPSVLLERLRGILKGRRPAGGENPAKGA